MCYEYIDHGKYYRKNHYHKRKDSLAGYTRKDCVIETTNMHKESGMRLT